jgi:hypothetical protein
MAKRPALQVHGTPWPEEMVEKIYPVLSAKIAGRKG